MSDTIRAFIAVEIESVIQAQLGGLIRNLAKGTSKSIKWTPEKNIHLTIKFLGDVESWEVSSLCELIRNTANSSRAFHARFTRLGAFPSLENPRVIWIGLDPSPALINFARLIDTSTRKIGFDGDGKSFTPHLTLGRVKPGITPEEQTMLSRSLQATPLPDLAPFLVASVTLFQSVLKPGGAEYYQLFSGKFNG